MAEAARTALVTGGARRIGKAIVEDLAAHGFAVAIHCNRSRDEAEALAAESGQTGGRAAVVAADLTDMQAADGLIAARRHALGPSACSSTTPRMFEDDSVDGFRSRRPGTGISPSM